MFTKICLFIGAEYEAFIFWKLNHEIFAKSSLNLFVLFKGAQCSQGRIQDFQIEGRKRLRPPSAL